MNAASSGDEKKVQSRKDNKKKSRRWDDTGAAVEDDDKVLDYSSVTTNGIANQAESTAVSHEPVDAEAAGTRTKRGQFVLKDLDSEVHSMLQNAEEKKSQHDPTESKGILGSGLGAVSGLFRNVIGGKVLTKTDLDKPIKGIEEHLLKKNVAREAAVRLCENVEKQLIGVKTGNFECISCPPSPAITIFSADIPFQP